MADAMQFSLFDPPGTYIDLLPTIEPAQPADGRRLTIAERFAAFHKANPHVYEGLRKVSIQMKHAGHKQWGVKAACEVLRWQFAMQTHDASGFKINNNYTSGYARLLMQQEPELQGFFETREKNSNG